ncbi:hypothetical protein ABZ897_11885 [Nonomuraea sp. NPDC046802]|uniref:hypothetical protein n=1 Tax=Nonomuraea sp. NPDC046802 TaxID=3154919 RepID=UPI0034072B7E
MYRLLRDQQDHLDDLLGSRPPAPYVRPRIDAGTACRHLMDAAGDVRIAIDYLQNLVGAKPPYRNEFRYDSALVRARDETRRTRDERSRRAFDSAVSALDSLLSMTADVSDVDLSDLNCRDVELLVGFTWSRWTIWPAEIAPAIRARSRRRAKDWWEIDPA